jgi:predicted nuclease with TOPRIM domain
MEKSFLAKYLKKARLRVSLPFLSYEVTLDDLIDSKDVDERIKRLSTIKNDLEETIVAVEQLQAEAFKSKNEADKLKETISLLEQDKSTAEAMLKLSEESFSRVLSRASSKGRVRGIIEGIIIGFTTGILSSLLAWYLTK